MKKTNKKNKKIKNTIKKIQKKGSGYHPLHLLEYSQLKDIDKAIMYFDNNCDSLNISNLNIPNKEISELKCNNYELELLKPLGQGSFNKTMLVEDKNKNKYCLRITYKNISDNIKKNELYGLYLQSYLSLPLYNGGVNCKYICSCYGFGNYKMKNNIEPSTISIESNQGIYGILEYIEGGDLFDEMNRKYQQQMKFTELEVSQIIGRLLIAVNCMHKHNFVHLDIKPENILCSDKDNKDIRLIDFGFIKYINPEIGFLDPKIYGRPGTPTYVSPEIIQGDNYNFKSDIWSIGITMLNLLLLENNFSRYMYDRQAKYSFVDIYKILFSLKKQFSEPCIDLLKKMLNINQDKRFNAIECLGHEWIKSNLSEIDLYNLKSDKCFNPLENMTKSFCKNFKNSNDYINHIEKLQKNVKAGDLQFCNRKDLLDKYNLTCSK